MAYISQETAKISEVAASCGLNYDRCLLIFSLLEAALILSKVPLVAACIDLSI